MIAFIQNFGLLILIGVILIGLFIWISRKRPQHDLSQPTRAENQDEHNHNNPNR